MDINRFLDFRNNKQLIKDIIGWSLCGWILLWIGNLLQRYFSSIFPNSPEQIRVVAFFLFLVLFFILVKTLFKRIDIFCKRNKTYIFNSKDWPNKWIFNGRPYLETSSELIVQSSRAGCLLKNHYWKDFEMNFEMKFKNDLDQTVGIVFRAEDLDNYFMLQLSGKHKQIKPHVRYHGGWELFKPKETKIFNNESYIESYINITLEVKNDTAYLKVNSDLEFTWVLPTHVDVNYRESGVEIKQDDRSNINEGIRVAGHVQEIPFRLNYGMVGFRMHPGEGAIIKGLKIEPL